MNIQAGFPQAGASSVGANAADGNDATDGTAESNKHQNTTRTEVPFIYGDSLEKEDDDERLLFLSLNLNRLGREK